MLLVIRLLRIGSTDSREILFAYRVGLQISLFFIPLNDNFFLLFKHFIFLRLTFFKLIQL